MSKTVCNPYRYEIATHQYSIDSNYSIFQEYAHGFCFAVLCCGYTLTDFPISIRLTSLALWQSNDCASASKATLMNMDKYFMWIHYERLHNHNKAKHNKTVCIFLGIYCSTWLWLQPLSLCRLLSLFIFMSALLIAVWKSWLIPLTIWRYIQNILGKIGSSYHPHDFFRNDQSMTTTVLQNI